ncbi:phosphoribosyltransferase family protein [Flavobacterium sp.]|uniref:phosphoribosyltransferase family protein n=1 Tax=Flavobacterium sp. TaxID=239 RepID=UPI003D0CB59E
MKTVYSLHKVVEQSNYPFSPSDYSWFKFGDKAFAKQFAFDLFEGFIKTHGEQLLSYDDIVVLPSPFLAIPTASNFLCHYFKRYLDLYLFKNNNNASIESKIYRNQTYTTDYGNLSFEDRINLISNDTYYIDANFIANKLCIFLDDIKITGSHEHTIDKILAQNDIKGEFFFVYFAELVNKDIHPNIENFFNYYAVKGVNEIIEVINRDDFQFNTRIIKYILKLDKSDFNQVMDNISKDRKDEFFHAAISNNYHKIEEYVENLIVLKTN